MKICSYNDNNFITKLYLFSEFVENIFVTIMDSRLITAISLHFFFETGGKCYPPICALNAKRVYRTLHGQNIEYANMFAECFGNMNLERKLTNNALTFPYNMPSDGCIVYITIYWDIENILLFRLMYYLTTLHKICLDMCTISTFRYITKVISRYWY